VLEILWYVWWIKKESLNRDGQHLTNINKMNPSSGWTQNILQHICQESWWYAALNLYVNEEPPMV
jgi:hypothetical protein